MLMCASLQSTCGSVDNIGIHVQVYELPDPINKSFYVVQARTSSPVGIYVRVDR